MPLLESMGILSQIDRNALARYCDSFIWWLKLREFIKKRGEFYTSKDRNGKPLLRSFPQVDQCLKLSAQLTRLEQEFGLTPSARSRISLPAHVESESDARNRFFMKSSG